MEFYYQVLALENVHNMKKNNFITRKFLFLFIIYLNACKSDTLRFEDSGLSFKEAQIKASHELYKYYKLRKNDLEYFEVIPKNHWLLLNYNPKIKVLLIELDPSTWDAVYINVDEAKLKELSEANLPFDKYDSLLTRELNYNIKTQGKIKTGYDH